MPARSTRLGNNIDVRGGASFLGTTASSARSFSAISYDNIILSADTIDANTASTMNISPTSFSMQYNDLSTSEQSTIGGGAGGLIISAVNATSTETSSLYVIPSHFEVITNNSLLQSSQIYSSPVITLMSNQDNQFIIAGGTVGGNMNMSISSNGPNVTGQRIPFIIGDINNGTASSGTDNNRTDSTIISGQGSSIDPNIANSVLVGGYQNIITGGTGGFFGTLDGISLIGVEQFSNHFNSGPYGLNGHIVFIGAAVQNGAEDMCESKRISNAGGVYTSVIHQIRDATSINTHQTTIMEPGEIAQTISGASQSTNVLYPSDYGTWLSPTVSNVPLSIFNIETKVVGYATASNKGFTAKLYAAFKTDASSNISQIGTTDISIKTDFLTASCYYDINDGPNIGIQLVFVGEPSESINWSSHSTTLVQQYY